MLGVGAVALVAAGRWASQSRVNGLCDAVDDLNAEIARFLNSGGCLAGIRGVEAIVEALKERGAAIDPQFSVTIQSAAQAATDEVRAVWDPRVQRLMMRIDGEPGARELNLCAAADMKLVA